MLRYIRGAIPRARGLSMSRFSTMILAIASLCLSFAVLGESPEALLSKARAAQGKETIRCSPQGGDGCISPSEALKRLKRGSTLRLLPGEYSGEMLIDTNNVIIEGDPEQDPSKMALSLRLNGDDCTVRGVKLQSLSFKQSCNVVDSVISSLSFEPNCEVKKRHKLFFGNCLIWWAGLYSGEYEAGVDFKGCTFYGGVPAAGEQRNLLDLGGKLNASFSKCIFFGGNCMNINGDNVKISLDTCLFYGVNSVARAGCGNERNSVARDVKDIRKVCKGSVSIKGQCLVAKPEFRNPLDFSCGPSCGAPPPPPGEAPPAQNSDFSGFLLKDGSPGRELGAGIALNLKNFPGYVAVEAASSKKPAPSGVPATPPSPPQELPAFVPKPPAAIANSEGEVKAEPPAADPQKPPEAQAPASASAKKPADDDDQRLMDAILSPPSPR